MKKDIRKKVMAATMALMTMTSMTATTFATAVPMSITASAEEVTDSNMNYKPDFDVSDIAVPDNMEFDENGTLVEVEPIQIEVIEDKEATVNYGFKPAFQVAGGLGDSAAPTAAQTTAPASSGTTTTTKATTKSDNWKTADKAIDYTVQGLKMIDSDAGKVAEYGKGVYDIVKSCYKCDIGGIYKSGKNFLKLIGVIKTSTANETTLADISQQISELKEVVDIMRKDMKNIEQQSYKNGFQTFDNGIIALDTNATTIQNMYAKAAELAEKQGIYAPADDASYEEHMAYNEALIEIASRKIKSFDATMENLRQNYILVAGEAGKGANISPFTTYDSYVNNTFNWDTQGYYARRAYRSNAEYQLKRAYAQLAVYFNIGCEDNLIMNAQGEEEDMYSAYTEQLAQALNAIEENGPGMAPWDISKDNSCPEKTRSAHCYTLNKDAFCLWQHVQGSSNCIMSGDRLNDYVSRLNGRSVKEDLELAGFSIANTETIYGEYCIILGKQGLAFNRDNGKVTVLFWDGTIKKVNDQNVVFYSLGG